VQYSEDYFISSGPTLLFERRWLPATDARAAVLIIHGYAEHSGRYDWTARQLAEGGYAVVGFDLRGHGKSDGERVFIRSMNEYLDDVDAALERVAATHRSGPIFLLGHSMGGAILALYACARLRRGGVRDRLAGLIFSGAALGSREKTPRVVVRLMLLLGRFFPKTKLRALEASSVSRDPAIVADYDSDPLNYRGKMPAALVASMIRGGRYTERHKSEITLPLLILHGSADELTDPEGSRELYEAASSGDKMLKIYEGLYHEILNEPERELVVADITAWLDRHTLAKTASAAM
jgi:lysophospholipase